MPKTFSFEQRVAIIDHTLEELSKGRALSKICGKDESSCSYAQWMRWEAEDIALRDKVVRAREDGATVYLEEIIPIGDNLEEDPNSRKVRIYAREKYAAMIAPRRFGQKLDVTSDGKALPQPIAIRSDRIEALLTLAAQRKLTPPSSDLIDVTPEPSLDDLMS